MGKKAKKAPVQTKKKVTLAKRFKCPFCANENVVECTMDRRKGIGALACRLCGASYQMPIHHLHEPIDVFSEWLDDCEAAARANQNDGVVAAATHIDDKYQDDDIGDDEEEEDDLLEEGPGPRKKAKLDDDGGKDNRVSTADLGLGDSESDDD